VAVLFAVGVLGIGVVLDRRRARLA
jgi:hypothetical protein